MAIYYPEILDLIKEEVPFSWSERDVMLYALAIGMGEDPIDAEELAFVNDSFLEPKPLRVVPSFASICVFGAWPGEYGTDPAMMVDGERDIWFHKPLPPAANVLATSRVIGAIDKGAGKGAVILAEHLVKDAATGDQLVTIRQSTFARGDGGFGGPSTGQPLPHAVPTRAPDKSLDLVTRPNQALLYRLTGDRRALHSDPAFARKAGFDRPILHGMCTYGLTCRAVLQTYADYDPSAFRRHSVRFSAPVYPGDTLTVDLWRDNAIISLEARVKERNSTVVKNGLIELA